MGTRYALAKSSVGRAKEEGSKSPLLDRLPVTMTQCRPSRGFPTQEPVQQRGLAKMPKGNIISIADRLRERRISSLLHRLVNSADRIEQRMVLARMEFELSQARCYANHA